MPTSLENLIEAQTRVFELLQGGGVSSDREMRTAMNRLMSLIRYAEPPVMAAFEAWRAAEGRRHLPAGPGGAAG